MQKRLNIIHPDNLMADEAEKLIEDVEELQAEQQELLVKTCERMKVLRGMRDVLKHLVADLRAPRH